MLNCSSWGRVRHGLALVCAAVFILVIYVSTERARPAATPVGRAMGIVPLEPQLAQIADRIALAHRQPTAGELAFARRAALSAPLDALPYYIIGAAVASTGAQGRVLVDMALRRDPRLRPAWSWTLADRAAGHDVPGITKALIRLAVLSPESGTLWPAVARISVDKAARSIIKAEISRDAAWRDAYLAALDASPVDRAVVFDLLQSVGRHRLMMRPAVGDQRDDRQTFLTALMQRGEYERAYLAWAQWLPTASQSGVGYVFDGDFKGLAGLPPFAWRLPNGAGGTTSIDATSGLALDYSGVDGAVVAQQALLVPPGRYRIVTQARLEPVTADVDMPALLWTVTCLPDARPLGELAIPLGGMSRPTGGAPFDIPAACEAQMLTLTANTADIAKRVAGTIRSVSIEAVK